MCKAVLICFLGCFGSVASTVTSYDYLTNSPKPNFAISRLPKLVQWGWVINSNTYIELAQNWGYALSLGNNSDTDIGGQLTNINSRTWGFIRAATNDPAHFKLSMGVQQRYMQPIPAGFYVTNTAGSFVGLYGTNTWMTNGGPAIASPEGNEDYWSNSATYWAATVAAVNSNAPLTIVLNGGEYGLNSFFGGVSQCWGMDPRVQAATNSPPWNAYLQGDGKLNTSWLLWFDYGSFRRAHQYQFLTDKIRTILPNRQLYVHYETDGESYRSLNLYGTNWATGNHYNGKYTRTLSDYPNFETYYKHFNTGFTGTQDMLTKFLDAVGAHITYGSPTNYSWLSGGYARGGGEADFADTNLYTGYLKCCYTAGMVGGIEGYYSSFTDVPFDSASPPHWLRQLMVVSHVHALFTHLDKFILDGDLLPGTRNNAFSIDQPAYEFLASTNNRVLSRKLRSGNEWIVTAWAANGIDTNITVTIPILGTMTVTASSTGTVYYATPSSVHVLDEYGAFPPYGLSPEAPTNLQISKSN